MSDMEFAAMLGLRQVEEAALHKPMSWAMCWITCPGRSSRTGPTSAITRPSPSRILCENSDIVGDCWATSEGRVVRFLLDSGEKLHCDADESGGQPRRP